MEEKGKERTREKDTAKDEGGVCVWRVWRPLRRAGGGCLATPFSPHILTPPSTNPQNPLVRSPFASWRTLSSVLFGELSRSFLIPFISSFSLLSNAMFNKHGLLLVDSYTNFNSVRKQLDWCYCFLDDPWWMVYNIWNRTLIWKSYVWNDFIFIIISAIFLTSYKTNFYFISVIYALLYTQYYTCKIKIFFLNDLFVYYDCNKFEI